MALSEAMLGALAKLLLMALYKSEFFCLIFRLFNMAWRERRKRTKQIDTFVLDGAKKDDVERMAHYVICAQKYVGEPTSKEVSESRQKGISWHMAVENQFVEVVRRKRSIKANDEETGDDSGDVKEATTVEKHYIYRTPDSAHYNTLLQSVAKKRDRLLSLK